MSLIRPDWPAPPSVQACATTRASGNQATHVGHDPAVVERNRGRLVVDAGLPGEPVWLQQVHGIGIVDPACVPPGAVADAAMTAQYETVCAVLTADCLPVLFCDLDGTRVAAAHAGWRGLAGGILEAVVAGFDNAGITPERILAWLGPAIGSSAYEVGDDVIRACPASDADAFQSGRAGHWHLDLYALARLRLAQAGVTAVYGGGYCTFSESQRFFSYRRDPACGRQATLIWLDRCIHD